MSLNMKQSLETGIDLNGWFFLCSVLLIAVFIRSCQLDKAELACAQVCDLRKAVVSEIKRNFFVVTCRCSDQKEIKQYLP